MAALDTIEKATPLLGLAGPEGMLLSAGIMAAINLGKAAHQSHQANKLAKTPRPAYNIPTEATGALNNAKFQASQRQLPGITQMQEKLDTNAAGAISNIKDVSSNGADLGSNIASVYRSNVGGQNQLALAGAQNYNNNQAALRGQQNQYAGYQDKAFDINNFQPYANNMAASSALREGAFRNLSAAGSDIATGIGGASNMNYWDKKLSELNGGGAAGGGNDFGAVPSPGYAPFKRPAMSSSSVGMNGALFSPKPVSINGMTPEEMQTFQESIMRFNKPNYQYE